MAPRLFLCDCGGTQDLDAKGIAKATGLACSRVHSGLCTHQIDRAAEALQGKDEVIIACGQEAETFAALADELDVAAPLCVDIRDRAGWSDEGGDATPKIAALLAGALRGRAPARTMDVTSDGVCLVIGASDVALPVADQLADALSVTCLLTDTPELLPGATRRYDAVSGRLRQASGAIGGFDVVLDGLRAADPAGRGALRFGPPRDGAASMAWT